MTAAENSYVFTTEPSSWKSECWDKQHCRICEAWWTPQVWPRWHHRGHEVINRFGLHGALVLMGFQEKTQRRDVVEINEVANVGNRLMWRSQGPGTSSLCIVKSGSSTFPIPMQERGFDHYITIYYIHLYTIDFLRPTGMKAGRSHISPTHSASSPCWSHRCLMRRTPLTAMTSHLEVHCFFNQNGTGCRFIFDVFARFERHSNVQGRSWSACWKFVSIKQGFIVVWELRADAFRLHHWLLLAAHAHLRIKSRCRARRASVRTWLPGKVCTFSDTIVTCAHRIAEI